MKRLRALLLSYCPINLVEQAGFAPATSIVEGCSSIGHSSYKLVVGSRWTVVGKIQSIPFRTQNNGDKIGESFSLSGRRDSNPLNQCTPNQHSPELFSKIKRPTRQMTQLRILDCGLWDALFLFRTPKSAIRNR